MLDYVPGSFRVTRHVRPKLSCRACETITQAPAPSLPIPKSLAGPGLLAHVAVAKFCDHLPLHRQAEIYAREGVEIDRGTRGDWIGGITRLLRPLRDALERHVMGGPRVFADDTTIPVLDRALERACTGRLWAYLRDDRPFGGIDPPAVLFHASPDRRGEHPRAHLTSFRGILPEVSCRRMAMPGSPDSTSGAGSSRRRAGPMSAASSSTCTRPRSRRSPRRRSRASAPSTPWRRI